MELEDKFIGVISNSEMPCVLYLEGESSFIRLEYKQQWDDGLNPLSQIRVFNRKQGISTAPPNWERLLKSLAINGITESIFEAALDKRRDTQILRHHKALLYLKDIFGEEHVDSVIETRGNNTFIDEINQAQASTLPPPPPKPTLTVVKGEET